MVLATSDYNPSTSVSSASSSTFIHFQKHDEYPNTRLNENLNDNREDNQSEDYLNIQKDTLSHTTYINSHSRSLGSTSETTVTTVESTSETGSTGFTPEKEQKVMNEEMASLSSNMSMPDNSVENPRDSSSCWTTSAIAGQTQKEDIEQETSIDQDVYHDYENPTLYYYVGVRDDEFYPTLPVDPSLGRDSPRFNGSFLEFIRSANNGQVEQEETTGGTADVNSNSDNCKEIDLKQKETVPLDACLWNAAKKCPKCHKSCAVILTVCNGCGARLDEVIPTATPNVITSFLLGIGELDGRGMDKSWVARERCSVEESRGVVEGKRNRESSDIKVEVLNNDVNQNADPKKTTLVPSSPSPRTSQHQSLPLPLSIRYEDENILIYDDLLARTPLHWNVVPTRSWIPDWRTLLKNPNKSLLVMQEMEFVVETAVFDLLRSHHGREWMEFFWGSKSSKSGHETVEREEGKELEPERIQILSKRAVNSMMLNSVPSQYHLHAHVFLGPLMPQDLTLLLHEKRFPKGRLLPWDYVRRVLTVLTEIEVSDNADNGVAGNGIVGNGVVGEVKGSKLPLTLLKDPEVVETQELVEFFEAGFGIVYDDFHRDYVKRMTMGHMKEFESGKDGINGRWTSSLFRYVVRYEDQKILSLSSNKSQVEESMITTINSLSTREEREQAIAKIVSDDKKLLQNHGRPYVDGKAAPKRFYSFARERLEKFG